MGRQSSRFSSYRLLIRSPEVHRLRHRMRVDLHGEVERERPDQDLAEQ
jgi:hypothetical protein